jgi:hypothetical protein
MPMTSHSTLLGAVVCNHCERVSMVAASEVLGCACAECGAPQREIPGGRVARSALPLFEKLESVVREAALSKSEATLIAAELESVSSRWEPPELVLGHVSPRLNGLRALYELKDDYSQLLLVTHLLLLCVGARLFTRPAQPPRSRYLSGVRLVGEGSDAAASSVTRRRA